MKDDNKLWIVGCGDIGRRVARLYENDTVHGIVSSHESAVKCEQLSIESHVIDLDSDFTLEQKEFVGADIYYFAPPPPAGAKDTRLKRFLKKLSQQPPRRIVLISTTGVYGDSGGEWIDESTPIKPQADRAVRRVSAEQILQRWALDTNCEIQIL